MSGRLLLAGLELYIVGGRSSGGGAEGEVGLDMTGDEALRKSADLIRECACLCSLVAELPMTTRLSGCQAKAVDCYPSFTQVLQGLLGLSFYMEPHCHCEALINGFWSSFRVELSKTEDQAVGAEGRIEVS